MCHVMSNWPYHLDTWVSSDRYPGFGFMSFLLYFHVDN